MATATFRSWSCVVFFRYSAHGDLWGFYYSKWRIVDRLREASPMTRFRIIWLRSTSHPGFGHRFTFCASFLPRRPVTARAFRFLFNRLPFSLEPRFLADHCMQATPSLWSLVLFCKRENWAASLCTLSHSVHCETFFCCFLFPASTDPFYRRVVRVQLSETGTQVNVSQQHHHHPSSIKHWLAISMQFFSFSARPYATLPWDYIQLDSIVLRRIVWQVSRHRSYVVEMYPDELEIA